MNRIFAASPLVSRACARGIATSEVRKIKPDLTEIKKKQQYFQAHRDIPIYLRGGPSDKILFITTAAMTFVGVVVSVEGLFRLSKK